jgi:hypothetical protein
MSFQQQLTNMTNQRQQALEQQGQQRQAIIDQWKPVVRELLQILGETAWGMNKYSVVEPVQSTTWTLVNFNGSKNSQFFVILDFDFVNIDAILAAGGVLPTQLITARSFRVIGKNEFKAGVSQTELERALSVAHQQGANQDKLPNEVKKALEQFPYQADEFDQRGAWKNIIMRGAGPVTVIMAGAGLLYLLGMIVDGIFSCIQEGNNNYGPEICSSTGSLLLFIFILILLLFACISFLIGGIWATNSTNYGRRYNKLPPEKKRLETFAMFPGMFMIAYLSFALVVGTIGLILFLGAEARQSELRNAIHAEFREHGL